MSITESVDILKSRSIKHWDIDNPTKDAILEVLGLAETYLALEKAGWCPKRWEWRVNGHEEANLMRRDMLLWFAGKVSIDRISKTLSDYVETLYDWRDFTHKDAAQRIHDEIVGGKS